MKTKHLLLIAVLLPACKEQRPAPTPEVRRADPQDRVVAPGEPYLERQFDIVADPDAFDDFCKAERDAGHIRLAKCPDGKLRQAVSNSKAQWVLIPNSPTLNFLHCDGEYQILGMDRIDFGLPPKETVWSRKFKGTPPQKQPK